MIKLFETHCRLPDGSIGEVCKIVGDTILVCNKGGWWKCKKQWVEENIVQIFRIKQRRYLCYSYLNKGE